MSIDEDRYPITPVLPITDPNNSLSGALLFPHGLFCVDVFHQRMMGVWLDLNRLIALTYYYLAVLGNEVRKLAHGLMREEMVTGEALEKIMKELSKTKEYDNAEFAIADVECQIGEFNDVLKRYNELRRKRETYDDVIIAVDDALEALQKVMKEEGVEVDVPDTYYIFMP